MTHIKKTETEKRLFTFRNQLHNLLIKYPEIRLGGDREGEVYAEIVPTESHSKPEYVYLPLRAAHRSYYTECPEQVSTMAKFEITTTVVIREK